MECKVNTKPLAPTIVMNILDLNEHTLLTIFDFCSLADLQSLSITCKKFQDLVARFDGHLLKKHSFDLLITGHRNDGKIYKKYVAQFLLLRLYLSTRYNYKTSFVSQLAPYTT